MDCYNSIIQIIPGIFISDTKINACEQIFKDFNINYAININNVMLNKNITSFNISVNSNNEYYNMTDLININLNKTNEFIISALQNNSNILICDINYNVPLLIIGAFLIKYLNLSYSDTIYWITKKTNILGISKNVCFQLFLFFQEL